MLYNDENLFFKAQELFNMAQLCKDKKSKEYFSRSKLILKNLIKESNNRQIISGSYITLGTIIMSESVKIKNNKNADKLIDESTLNEILELNKKAFLQNPNNSQVQSQKIGAYLDCCKYKEALDEFKKASKYEQCNFIRNHNFFDKKLCLIKYNHELKHNFINRDRTKFMEELFKYIVEIYKDNTYVLKEIGTIVLDSLVIFHSYVCLEYPKTIIEFYEILNEYFHEYIYINAYSIILLSAICLEDYKYVECFVKEALNKYRNLDKDDIVTYKSFLHAAYIGQGRFEECKEIDEYNLKYSKNNTTLHQAGLTMYKLKMYKEAVKYLKQALFIYEDEVSYKLLGDCYFEMQNFDLAIEYYNKALAFIEKGSPNISKVEDDKNLLSITSDKLFRCSKKQIYDNIINSYINIKDYNTAIAYNTLALREFINEDSFRMMDKMLSNLIEISKENKLKDNKLVEVESRLKKEQENINSKLSKVRKWAELIMELQNHENDSTIDENDWNSLEEKLLEIAENMCKSVKHVTTVSYNKIRKELSKTYSGLENKSLKFLATGEYLFIVNENQMIDYAPIMVEFCKVVELELNEYIKRKTGIEVKYTLGALNKKILEFNDYDFTKLLPKIVEYRNGSAHSSVTDRDKVNYLRNILFEQGFLQDLIDIKKIKTF